MIGYVMTRLGIPTPNHSDNQCLPISVPNNFNERAHVQTLARTVNRGRNAKSGYGSSSEGSAWAVGNHSSSPLAMGAFENMTFKTLRITG